MKIQTPNGKLWISEHFIRISLVHNNIEFKVGPISVWSVGQSNQMLPMFVEWFMSDCCRFECEKISKRMKRTKKAQDKCMEIRK